MLRLMIGMGCAALSPLYAPPALGQEPPAAAIPADACILTVDLPDQSRLTIDGRDFSGKRQLTFRGLDRERIYLSSFTVRYPGGDQESGRLMIEGGRRVWLALAGPRPSRPEPVIQTADAGGAVAWSEDGRYVMCGRVLYDATTGRALRSFFRPLAATIDRVAIHPDARQVALCTSNELVPASTADRSTLYVWDVATGRQLHALALPTQSTTSIAYSDGGRYLSVFGVSSQWNTDGSSFPFNEARVFEAGTGAQFHNFRNEAIYTRHAVFSPDGRFVFTGTRLGHGVRDKDRIYGLAQWEIATGRQVRNFTAQKEFIASLAITSDGKTLASGWGDGAIMVWDVTSGNQIGELADPGRKGVNGLAISPGRRLLATGSTHWSRPQNKVGELRVWDVATGRLLWQHRQPGRTVQSLAFSPDGTMLLADVGPGTIFEAASGGVVRSLAPNSDFLTAAEVIDGAILTVVSPPSGHAVRDFTQGAVVATLTGGHDYPFAAPRFSSLDSVPFTPAFSPDGKYLVAAAAENTAVLWDLPTGRRLQSFEHKAKVSKVAFSPDGSRLVTAVKSSADAAQVIIWDPATGAVIRRISGHFGVVEDMAFSADFRYLVTASAEMRPETLANSSRLRYFADVRLWDTSTGEQLRRFPDTELDGFRSRAAISPDGRLVAASGGEAVTAILYDSTSGRATRKLASQDSSAAAGGVAFSPDGKLLVAVPELDDGKPAMTVWDVSSGRLLQTLRGHTRAVLAARFAPDGRRLISIGFDGTPIVWDLSTGQELARLVSVEGGREWLALAPTGLFDGSSGGSEKVNFRVGGGLNVVPVDRFFRDFYRPGLLADLVRGDRPLPETALGLKLAPRVKILAPAPRTDVARPSVDVQVEVVDRGGGIQGPWLNHNGSRVLAPGTAQRQGDTLRRTFEVLLVEGENHLEVRAASEDGSWESEPAAVMVYYREPVAEPSLFVVAVGVNRYAQGALNLRFAADDARAIGGLFRNRGAALYGQERVHVRELIDEQATSSGIRRALEDVAGTARPQDVVLLFLAGHGTTLDQRYYFLPHEFRHQAQRLEDDIRSQGLPDDALGNWLGAVPALKRVVIFDTCQSGGALALGGTARNPFSLRGALERLSRAQGVHTLAAAAATDDAQEVEQLRHGVLTYALLAAVGAVAHGPLDGQGLSRPDENVVEVRDWFAFAQEKVPLLTRLYFNQEQMVGFNSLGRSFPLMLGSE